ncbi:hypothetical protein LR48_Vigan07g153100 [Vigna angularis]|uniref:Ubiquitin-like protease family profile domain-containing protein n=1 Tax=Phaseolus angularis TaxID=3914 RepID=A0A0L9UZ07_PHAAN|nr:hypothetical protein LR48_Vigan07g153100 [Vigna angularis]
MKEDIRKKMTQEITKKVQVELYDEVAEMVVRQFQQPYEDYGNRPPPSPVAEHVVPPTEAQIPLYLHHQDVRELVSGREEINITLIQLWMMYMFDASNKKGFNDVYGFIDPSMTHERNKFNDIQTYITTCFGMGKEIYFLPYIHGCHWQLLVISIPENTVVWFCSLHKSPPSPLRHVVDCSLATHMMLSGRSTATAKKLAWVALKRFNRTTPIRERSIQLVRKTLAKYVVDIRI